MMEERLSLSENCTRRTKTDPKWVYLVFIFFTIFILFLILCFFYTPNNKDCDRLQSCKDSFEEHIMKDLTRYIANVIYLCIMALGLSLLLLMLLYVSSAIFAWCIMSATLIMSVASTIAVWATNFNDGTTIHTLVAALVTFLSFVFLIMLFVTLQRRALLIQMFTEATLSIAATPSILIPSLITIVVLIILKVIFIVVVFFCINVGNWKHPLKVFTQILGILAFFWLVEFVFICQNMMVAYSTYKWYFTYDKANVRSSVKDGATNVFKYHQGSAILGVFLLTFILFIKMFRLIFGKVEYFRELNKLFECVSQNTLFEVSIHGMDYVTSGRSISKRLSPKRFQTMNINGCCGFVLLMAKLIVLYVTLLSGYYMIRSKNGDYNIYTPLFFVLLFALFFMDAIVSTYQVAINTIYICLCDDMMENNGDDRQYYMSKELMELCIENEIVLLILCYNLTPNTSNECEGLEFCDNFEEQLKKDLPIYFSEIVYLCLIAIGCSFVVLILLYLSSTIFMWFIIVMTAVISTVPTIILWASDFNNGSVIATIVAVLVTMLSLLFFYMLYITIKRRVLLLQMLKEAILSVKASPMLLIPPVVIFLLLVAMKVVFLAASFAYVNVGNWDNPMKVFTQVYGAIGFLWLLEFGFGGQNMIIAYSVSSWYHSIDKSRFSSSASIREGGTNILLYHLGSIAMGSICQALILFEKLFQLVTRRFAIFSEINHSIDYIGHNNLIEVVLHGNDYLTSGRALKHKLEPKRFENIKVTGTSAFLFGQARLLVLLITLLCGYFMLREENGYLIVYTPLVFALIFGLFFIDALISAVQVAITTIYICLCCDLTDNNGREKPYYMSSEMMELCTANNAFTATQ